MRGARASSRSDRFPLRWLGLVLLLGGPASADDPPKVDPAEAHIRAVLANPLRFDRFVFDGDRFPRCDFERPDEAERAIGPYQFRATFYDAQFQRADEPRDAGPFGAVVEVAPESGRSIRRFFTVYRTTAKVADDWTPGDLAGTFGIDRKDIDRQRDLIASTWKGRPFAEFARDPASARLLTGLRLAPPGEGPVHKYDDAFARERQFWVSLKRRLSGLDKVYPELPPIPTPIEGTPAPVLREGTPEEAGVRPDTAEKIDAACRAFEADTDEAFAICLARRGVIVLHRAYGTRDGRPMTVETRSWMASITKTMSASLMMMLVDRGIVDLDGRIDKFLPTLRGFEVETPLRVRHLYTHTNGLDQWPWPGMNNDELPDIEERVADYYPLLKVGKGFGYNGVGYELGGKIIEAVSGEAVPIFFRNHLLAPLGCDDTDVIGTHADARSLPLDIAKIGQMLLNRGAYGKWRFFRPETFERMLPKTLTDVLGPDTNKRFGIGLDGGDGKIGHGAASAATFHVDLNNEFVVVMTRNKQGRNQDKYNGMIWEAIRDGLIDPAEGRSK